MVGTVGARPAPHLMLREATRPAHEAAEATAGMRLLLGGELDALGYARLLQAQLGLFRKWEGERAAWLAGLGEWRYISRVLLLEADLGGVGHFADIVGCYRVGADHVGDALYDTPTYWGELYVIEGSALGGQVIARRLRELYPSLPHHFYAVGENAPSRWRTFQGLLDAALPDDASVTTAIHAAQRMFARFQQTLKDPAAHD